MTDLLRYSELIRYRSYDQRLAYLKLDGEIGRRSYGVNRFENQALYHSREWKNVRARAVARDFGQDLGLDGYTIFGPVIVHHMNPINELVLEHSPWLALDLEFLITVSTVTHMAIHYGTRSSVLSSERRPNDTKLW